jgi:peptidoglycan-associated lipoprotein
MNTRRMKWIVLAALLASILFAGGCAKKKVVQAPPPPPPPPPAPTVSLKAAPDAIDKGQSTTLTWQTANAQSVTISGLGTVAASGSQQVTPSDSTTYDLTATGPGGTRDASARVTVTQPVAAVPQPSPTDEELFARNVKDVFFDYDKYVIRADQQGITQTDAQFLQTHPNVSILIEGHCDDRGSEEYNLALGDNRANAVKEALVKMGISASRIRTISYGKEKPFCTQDDDACWQQNRRGHFDGKFGQHGGE